MSALIGPFSWATHSWYSGTSCWTTSVTWTSGGPGLGASSFFAHPTRDTKRNAPSVIMLKNASLEFERSGPAFFCSALRCPYISNPRVARIDTLLVDAHLRKRQMRALHP